MRARFELLIGTCAAALCTALAGQASAQAAAPAPAASPAPVAGATMGEVVVTARRTTERLQDVPLAVTAVQGAELRTRGVTQVQELRQVVAGLNIAPAAGRTDSLTYAIRGQRATDVAVTQDAPVALYMDDVIIAPLYGSNLGLFDLENVQVLKGPQGTLFGRNTTGGAVLFTTAKPTGDYEGSLRVGGGNYGTFFGTGVLNVPVNDKLRFRIAVDGTKRNGFGQVVGGLPAAIGRPLGDRNEYNLRFSTAFNPTDEIQTLTTLFYSHARSGGPAFVLFNPPNPLGPAQQIFGATLTSAIARQNARSVYDAESNIPNVTKDDIFGVNHTDTITLNDNLTFKNIFGFRHTRTRQVLDFDGTSVPINHFDNHTNINVTSEEAQLQGNAFNDKLKFVAGAYYFDESGFDGNSVLFVFGGPSHQGGNLVNRAFAAYAQGDYKLTDTLTLTTGFRYSIDQRRYSVQSGSGTFDRPTSCNLTSPTGAKLPISACVISGDASFGSPTWNISLQKKFSVDSMVYLAHRHGYRSGGFNLRASSNADIGPFEPERVNDVELGFKDTRDLTDNIRLRSNIAVYHQWYTNIQRNVTALNNGQLLNLILNAASAHVDGAEAEFTLAFGRDFKLGFNYAYTKPEYDDFPLLATVNGVPGTPTNYKDRDFVYIPRHQINVDATYTHDLGMGKLNLNANVYYQSSIVFSEEFQNEQQLLKALSPAARAVAPGNLKFGQGGYTLVNLRAELENINGTGITIAAFAKNLTDQRYLQSGNIFYSNLGVDTGVYGDPRTFGAELTYKF